MLALAGASISLLSIVIQRSSRHIVDATMEYIEIPPIVAFIAFVLLILGAGLVAFGLISRFEPTDNSSQATFSSRNFFHFNFSPSVCALII